MGIQPRSQRCSFGIVSDGATSCVLLSVF
jgi:hypothetical protein